MADKNDPSDRYSPGWYVVAMQASAVVGLIVSALILAATAHAETSTIGRTWPIAEPDAMTEIEAAAARQPANMAGRFGPRSTWSALKGATLGITQVSQVRSVVPFYTLEEDVRLPDGRVLYPNGFTFNPLTYVSLPQHLVIIHPRDLAWALKTAALTDWIILTGGGDAQGDALSLGEKHGRALFILEERVKDRLGLTVAPVIVRQVGQRLELNEIRLDPKGRQMP